MTPAVSSSAVKMQYGQQQGYGLGLGIARNIAHAHGGELSMRNLQQGGLRVTLTLPR